MFCLMTCMLLVCVMVAHSQPTHEDWSLTEEHEDWPTKQALYSIMENDREEFRETNGKMVDEIKQLKESIKIFNKNTKKEMAETKKMLAESQKLIKINLEISKELQKLKEANQELKLDVQTLKEAHQKGLGSTIVNHTTTHENHHSTYVNDQTNSVNLQTTPENYPSTYVNDQTTACDHKLNTNFNDIITQVKDKTDMYEADYSYMMSMVSDLLWIPDYSSSIICVVEPYTYNTPTQIATPGISPKSVYQTGPTEVLLAADQGLYVLTTAGTKLYKVVEGKIADLSVDCNTAYLYDYSSHDVVTVMYNSISEHWERSHSFTAGQSDQYPWNTIEVVSDSIYLSSYETDTIHTYTLTGSHIATHGGRKSQSLGQLHNPLLCGTDSQGALLVCDEKNNRLQVLSPNGEWEVYSLEGVVGPYDVTVDTSGNLWVLWWDEGTRRVSKFSV